MRMGMQTVRQLALSATMITGLFLGGVLSPWAATAATYYVATDGNDANQGTQAQPFQTINRGIGVLAAGDTLYLRQGTYAEGIDSNYQAIPGGTTWNNATVIASFPGETATLAPSGDGAGTVIALPNTTDHYIIFDRLVIDAAKTRYGLALGSSGAHHLRFQAGEIKNSGQNTSYHTPFDPGLDEAEGVELRGSFNEVIHSKIYGSPRSYGFYVGGHDNLIDGNEIHDNGGFGIQIYEGRFPTVTTDNHIVRNNTIYNNGHFRRYGAITVGQGSNCRIYNNVIYNNFGGIWVYKASTNQQVYNNTLYNNPNEGIRIYASSIGTIVQNNILYQNGSIIVDDGTGTIQSNNFTTDPKFVNASANDFRLQSTSPAINAGAYEFQVSTVPSPNNPTVPSPNNLKVISVVP